jgi:hypothetical protein
MPVPLPPAPVGGTPLPQEPADPPTLEDVYNAVEYTLDIRLSHGKLQKNLLASVLTFGLLQIRR